MTASSYGTITGPPRYTTMRDSTSTVDLDATLVTAICRKHEQMKSLLLLR